MKIVLNRCYGGFGLSVKAVLEIAKVKESTLYAYAIDQYEGVEGYFCSLLDESHTETNLDNVYFFEEELVLSRNNGIDETDFHKKCNAWGISYDFEKDRTNEILVEVVERLGKDANASFSNLEVIEIPDDCEYIINEYDGYESVVTGNNLQEF